ncbi:hypothetical protein [Aedoeadaptatus coxii]|uniref:hypothetical protein n=1 Tax=Aedoeadaptatus coxii TaxID=755172 RepID=UPI002AD3D54E|nr:hypothetical protein [Peptoniphilus coxii]
MYAIVLDLNFEILKNHFEDPHKIAFDEISHELKGFAFEKTTGNIFIHRLEKDGLRDLYCAINRLSTISWLKESLRELRAFKIEDWSNFTSIIKES